MYKPKKYRRKHDGLVIEAVQYQLPWEHDHAVTEVAEFILKLSTDKSTAAVHDRVLDVVKPQTHLWDTDKGKATLLIVDPDTGHSVEVEANSWVARGVETEGLSVIGEAAFTEQYEAEEKVQGEWDKLSAFILAHLPGEGEPYVSVARNVAAALIGAGWRKGSP